MVDQDEAAAERARAKKLAAARKRLNTFRKKQSLPAPPPTTPSDPLSLALPLNLPLSLPIPASMSPFASTRQSTSVSPFIPAKRDRRRSSSPDIISGLTAEILTGTSFLPPTISVDNSADDAKRSEVQESSSALTSGRLRDVIQGDGAEGRSNVGSSGHILNKKLNGEAEPVASAAAEFTSEDPVSGLVSSWTGGVASISLRSELASDRPKPKLHNRTHSRSRSRQLFSSPLPLGNVPSGVSAQKDVNGENRPPLQVGMMLNPGFTFGKASASAQPRVTPSMGPSGSDQPVARSGRRHRTHSRQLSSISGMQSFAPSGTGPSGPGTGSVQRSSGLQGVTIGLRADDSAASASGSSSSGDSPVDAVFPNGQSKERSDIGVRTDSLSGEFSGGSGGVKTAQRDLSDSGIGFEMPTFSFGSDSPNSTDAEMPAPFAFPKRLSDDGMRFSVASPLPILPSDAFAAVNPPTPQLVIPSVAIVPSSPLPEDLQGEDFPFAFPNNAITPFADEASKIQQRLGAFSFGRPAAQILVSPLSSSVSSPVLGTVGDFSTVPKVGGRRKHSHSRSTSVSGYAALSGTFGVDMAALSSLGGRPGSPAQSAGEAGSLSTDEIRNQTLLSLEGKRQGANLSVDWASRSGDMLSQRNSWDGSRRRPRSSMTDKVEIALPSFEEDGPASSISLPITPLPAAPDSPKRTQRAASAPSSPSRFNFPAGPQTTRRDTFGKIVPLVESSPYALAGLGITGAPTGLASVATTLRTLVEEEEGEEDEMMSVELDTGKEEQSSRQTAASDQLTEGTLLAMSPPVAPASSKFRPLRLLSISSSAASSDIDNILAMGRRSMSIDHMKDTSLDFLVSSPPNEAASSDANNPSRRSSISKLTRARSDSTSRQLWNRRFSGDGPSLSSHGVMGSVKAFHEVDQDQMLPATMDAWTTRESCESGGLDGEAQRPAQRQSMVGGVGQASIDILQRALVAEEENQAMREDIAGWRGRVRKVESDLDSERAHGRLLRERLRKLGDHLSAMSSMPVPGSLPPTQSPPAAHSTDDSVTPTMSQLQAQLFALAASVESERREKNEALAESQALRDELARERTARISVTDADLTDAPDVISTSVDEAYLPTLALPGITSYYGSPVAESTSKEKSPLPPLRLAGSHHSSSMPSLPEARLPDFAVASPSPPTFTLPCIPVLVNDDGDLVEIPSGPPTPEPDLNASRIRTFAFPTGRIQRPPTRPKSMVDPFFKLNMPPPDSASPATHTFGKVFGRSPNPEEDADLSGLGILCGLPPIDSGVIDGVAVNELGSDVPEGVEAASWEATVDISKSCSCCSGPVFAL